MSWSQLALTDDRSASVPVRFHECDHVPDQTNAEALLEYAQPLGYDSLRSVVVKEGQAAAAGDRPEVRITRFVISAKTRGHGRESKPSARE